MENRGPATSAARVTMTEMLETIEEERLRDRAIRPLAATPRPFLTWAGSKRLLLEQLVDVLPDSFRRYYEPFLGSGALLFLLQPRTAIVGDTCTPLIETYQALAQNPVAVWRHLVSLRPDKETYYAVRAKTSRGKYKRAAQFIFLNKTCWNGLYRVNLSGKFNVPFGRPNPNAAIADRENLIACGGYLAKRSVTIRSEDFAATLDDVGENDLVYLDPPYVTGHRNNGFVDYNEILFSWEDQCRLAWKARELRDKGAYVVVSNADHPAVRDLYSDFSVTSFERKATISGKLDSRGRSSEIIATSY